jgi:hypothetical protein
MVLNKAATLTASSGLSNTAIVTGITNVGAGISVELSVGRKLQSASNGTHRKRQNSLTFLFFQGFQRSDPPQYSANQQKTIALPPSVGRLYPSVLNISTCFC